MMNSKVAIRRASGTCARSLAIEASDGSLAATRVSAFGHFNGLSTPMRPLPPE